MKYYDVFNGDADGICALHQLRLDSPRPDATLITGVKRDIALLDKIKDIRESDVTVLDISLDKNRDNLAQLLEQGNKILYIDHHFSGDIPNTENIEVHIDPQPLTCTSIIVDSLINGKYRPWAVAGAFGDNLDEAALRLAEEEKYSETEIGQLKEIGILLNYNGYGATVDDLFFSPDALYREVHAFENPLEFFSTSRAMEQLRTGYQDDMERAQAAKPLVEASPGRIFELAGKPWARRVSGVFSNTLARECPDMAHGLIIQNSDGTLRISVRAPLSNRTGADVLCRKFPTGGGRAAAAGINNLPPEMKDSFLQAFMEQFSENKDS